ncbi:unnamed protein product [Ranitomeya imitator]|uniref:Uncharacterized protein n=1 Tax=Ranitomeya imitator TaxID=111125 RepID=A0ABN9LSD9_9NEOB|nr:unnamed protein product [Ranitomeya imitator]
MTQNQSRQIQLLADLENSPMFANDLDCQKFLMEAMKYHLLPERRSMMQSPRTKPRKSTVGALYAVGGMDATKGATTIEKYDLRTNSWIQVSTMNGRRLQFGVAVIDNKLYVVGGRDGLKTSNTVESFNPINKVWTIMPPMSTHRRGGGGGGGGRTGYERIMETVILITPRVTAPICRVNGIKT